ncbi:unnamed protein product [Somion occarium]|uniref:Metallo-beta-lactamase domain-containing protein n=1 Tax=Somion occarium TaxID=3059160 RepID=A0ABP1DL83_9APHY
MGPVKTVDKLTVTFLVDNSIEWFTKLPPGFTHEMRVHLSEHDPPIDPITGAPVLDLEKYCCAHGFSALIETQIEGSDPHLVLFDTGPDSRSIARNVVSMKVPIERVERVIISHWHSDHSGGLLSFLRLYQEATKAQINKGNATQPCVADLHPDRPYARGIAPLGKVVAQVDPGPTFDAIRKVGGVVETHPEGHTVADGTVYVSGEIPRVTSFENGLLGGMKWVGDVQIKQGEWVPDEDIVDERYAAVDVAGKGLVIFSACSHAGIVNVVRDAVEKFQRPIYMIIGGLHLASPDLTDRIEPTVDFLANKLRPAPMYVLPMHCSGFASKIALERALGEGCVPTGTGIRVVVDGQRNLESQGGFMTPPTIAS